MKFTSCEMKILIFAAVAILASEAFQIKGPNGEKYSNVVKHKAAATRHDDDATEEKDIFEINKGLEGLIHGDVVPRKQTKNTAADSSIYWPNKTVPFVYSPIVSLEAIGTIELARQEYRLRTCLDFVNRTDEENYISFQTRGGCWSFVGVVGGSQTISIGFGCERLGTVCHEMMHAIGVWHEQSRADRDDYVQIMWDVIEEGTENNFNKYDWELTDARRVPYDYNSIMHYSDTGFSTTGDPTIVTRDPAFQDIIGQRNAFSKGDSDKINRMYQCSDTVLVSYNCNFDDDSECGYVQDFDSDDTDWLRYDVGDKSVPVPSGAPATDATLGIVEKGTYMVLNTSGSTAGKIAEMRSRRFVTRSDVQCLQFSYYLNLAVGSASSVAVHIATLDDVTGEVMEEGEPLITLNTDYGTKWQVERMTIHAPSAYKILFKGMTGSNSDDVIGVDDVSVQDKPCDDAYFVVQDYSTYLDTYVQGEYFLSPVMTSTQGYNFRLEVYPRGTVNSTSGYMGLRFGLVQGPNDDDLAWPFCNKYIRMMVSDQNDNPLYALGRSAEYLTSEDNGGYKWNKPTSEESVGYHGYSNFMSINDLTQTNNYLKHDSLMVSINIQDMNWVNGDVCTGPFSRSVASQPLQANLRINDEPSEEHQEGNYENHQQEHQEHQVDHHHENHLQDHLLGHHVENHENNYGEGHEHHHDGHHEEHHHNHEDHQHEHDHEDDGNHDEQTMISVGTVVGFTIASAAFVLVVMSTVLCCIVKSHKESMKSVVNNNVFLHDNTSPGSVYPHDRVTFDPLPAVKVQA